MKHKRITYRAFTLIELVVTIAILAMMISFSSVIFKVSIDTHRVAGANSEIMQILRAITNQLDSDFKGLRKDGEIFVIWLADDRREPGEYERFDRIIFFANGDFHSYHPDANTGNIVRGNLARISYMLARNSYDPEQGKPAQQEPHERVLVRTQNVLTDNSDLPPTNFADFNDGFEDEIQWRGWRDKREFDRLSMHEWGMINWSLKADILTVMTDVNVGNSPLIESVACGTTVVPDNHNLFHLILSEGVGEFQIQGWHDARGQWLPSIDPDNNGDFDDDTNFYLEGSRNVPGILYTPQPDRGYGGLYMANGLNNEFPFDQNDIDQEHFNEIPGLGRAFKFTFTLYDSRGIFENGRIFSHIVYLDD